MPAARDVAEGHHHPMATLPPGMFPPPLPQSGPQPSYGQHLPPGRGGGASGGGGGNGGTGETPFSDAFDFSFSTYATPGVVKIVYVIMLVVCVAEYASIVLWSLVAGLISPLFVLAAILLGWILPLLTLLMGRLTLEHYLATVRTAQETRALRERADLWFRTARP